MYMLCAVLLRPNKYNCSTKVLCPQKTSFLENRKDTKVVYPVTWTYDICAFDTGTYYDYY